MLCGALCPMSRGGFNKFGYRGYIRAVVRPECLLFRGDDVPIRLTSLADGNKEK